jgi:23S rRNA (adenine2503-C2)-methyltransferase
MPEVLLGLTVTEIQAALGGGLPAYRARQIYDAIYRRGVDSIHSITTLPAALRGELALRFEVGSPMLERRFESTDGTRRYLLRLADLRTVEAVLMPEEARDTVCISTQVGCPVNCAFCLTARMGLERNLTAGEIDDIRHACRSQGARVVRLAA